MKGCKYVALADTFSHDLEEIRKDKYNTIYKLKEVNGTIIHCESEREGLVIKLNDHLNPERTKDKLITWAYEKEMPIPAVCGQKLRCFYEKSFKKNGVEKIEMDGYELYGIINGVFENEGILRRGIKPSTFHEFIEFKRDD